MELAEFGYFDLSKSRIELRDPAGNTKLAQNRLPLYFALFLLSAGHSRLLTPVQKYVRACSGLWLRLSLALAEGQQEDWGPELDLNDLFIEINPPASLRYA